MPKMPMVTPAIAGPTMRARLKVAEFIAMAFAMSSRPTISTANAWRVGMSTALVMPSRAARTMMCQISTRPLAASPNSTNASSIWMTWVAISVLRLGRASAISPPNRPRIRTGRNWTAATTPSRNGSLDSWSTSQACATDCIQVPTREIP